MHWRTLLLAAVVTFGFLALIPAPEGCGCGHRKRRMADAFYVPGWLGAD